MLRRGWQWWWVASNTHELSGYEKLRPDALIYFWEPGKLGYLTDVGSSLGEQMRKLSDLQKFEKQSCANSLFLCIFSWTGECPFTIFYRFQDFEAIRDRLY